MGKRVAIVQSAYIPWKGYFDLINSVDEFVIYDSVQYTERDWRNRNRIKTCEGLRWLSIPVSTKGKRHQKINEAQIYNSAWAGVHFKTLTHAYGKAPFFGNYADRLGDLYRQAGGMRSLSQVNRLFITTICDWLGISTCITRDTRYDLSGDKSERLLNICRQTKASHYLSGPAARDYLDVALFVSGGVRVQWADYGGYCEYPQLHGPFEHAVSVLDLLFSVGPDARQYLKTVGTINSKCNTRSGGTPANMFSGG
ncbi:MAG: WbqC family protein [Syntrophobacteraceae bacterium]